MKSMHFLVYTAPSGCWSTLIAKLKLQITVYHKKQLLFCIFLQKNIDHDAMPIWRTERPIVFNLKFRLEHAFAISETQIDDNYITVFQEIGAHEYLVELARATHVNELIYRV